MNSISANDQAQYYLGVMINSYVTAGGILSDIKNGELYKKEIGQGIDTWHDYLAQPEVGLSVREANEMIKIAQYVVENNLSNPGTIPLATLKYMAKRGVSDEEMFDSARTLTTKDFKERYYDHVTNDGGERTYSYMVMKRCKETGTLSRIMAVESEEVLSVFNDKIENEHR